jgi:hypothetical protein
MWSAMACISPKMIQEQLAKLNDWLQFCASPSCQINENHQLFLMRQGEFQIRDRNNPVNPIEPASLLWQK